MTNTATETKDCFVSVIIVDQQTQYSPAWIKDVHAALKMAFTNYEILVIRAPSFRNHSAPDDSDLLNTVPSIRLLQLSGIVSKDVACAAGIENAIGDFVILLSPHDPLNALKDLVDLCQTKADVILGVAKQQHKMSSRLVRPLVTKIYETIGYAWPWDATGLCCLSRRAVNAVLLTGRFYHQFTMRILKTGYEIACYPYELAQGVALPKTSFIRGIRDGLRLVVFNSTKPLRWMSVLGLSGSSVACLFATYSLLVNFFKSNVVEGWTTIVLFLSFMFFLLFLILAFFGEYLGRLLEETGNQLDYAVAIEKTSAIMIDSSRINVIHDSTGGQDSSFSNPTSNQIN
ncbi:MAG: glycosyl transferase family 2 [Alphaproteobacteria bacterium]|nr:glycosyl transferase family 2 [Alphaproteobacteria bacterium]